MKTFDTLIGNTPMIKINYKYQGKVGYVFAKLEYYNISGSIKDRLANHIIQKAYKDNVLKEGMPIIEATSGNTGIAFAAIGAFYHHPVHIFMPDWVSIERIKIMQLYGASVHLVSREEGGFKEAIRRADELALKIGGFRPDQFNNVENIEAHYETTGSEIVRQVKDIDAFVSGIGTGGTLMGVGKKIKEVYHDAKVIALEPDTLPMLSTGTVLGEHKIEGIGDDFIPSIVDKNFIDKILLIHDEDAMNMSRLLARKLGLGVGISSGANFLAAVLSGETNVVTVFPDDFKKYISTDLSLDVDSNEQFVSNQIELIDFEEV